MLIEKKLMSGEYGFLNKMVTDINGGTPSKEIETIIFKNMMKFMLKECNCWKKTGEWFYINLYLYFFRLIYYGYFKKRGWFN